MHVCVTQVKNDTEHEMHMVFDAGTHSYEDLLCSSPG